MKHHLVYWLVAWLYNYLASLDRDAKVTFMNYGFALPDPSTDARDNRKDDPDLHRKSLYWKGAGGRGDPKWDWSEK